MDGSEKLEKIGVRKPTYEEIESEYGKLADRCEFAEKLNKSLERVIVEKDGTIETLTRDIEDYARIVGEKNKIIESLTDLKKELETELDDAKLGQAYINNYKNRLNAIYGLKPFVNDDKPVGMSVTDVIVARLKDAKEIVNLSDHKKWEVINVNGNDICTRRLDYEKTIKWMFHVSDYRKTWIFVDDREVKSDEHDNS